MTKVLPGLLPLLLTGCAALSPMRVPDPASLAAASQPPPAVRLQGEDAGSAAALSGAPAPARAPSPALDGAPLTLERALAVALANNPDILGGGWEVEAAQARARQASSGYWPALDIWTAYRHHWKEERLAPARGLGVPAAFSQDIFSGDVTLTVPLLSGGRVVSAHAAAELLAGAAGMRLSRSREELVFDVRSAFFAILGQEKLIEATRRSLEALAAHRDNTLKLIEARKAARVDLLNVEVRLAELGRRLVEQRGELELQKRLLLVLMGLQAAPPGGLVLEGDLAPFSAAPDAESLAAAAIDARADISALDMEIEAQARRVDVSRAEYWPVLSARATYGSRLSLENEYDDLGFVGLELAIPIFDGFRTQARVEEERAILETLVQRRRSLALGVRREVESAVILVETARAALDATEKSIEMAEESLRITMEKAALGHGTATDVLDAQAALLQAETARYAAMADSRTALALLELTVGGGI